MHMYGFIQMLLVLNQPESNVGMEMVNKGMVVTFNRMFTHDDVANCDKVWLTDRLIGKLFS